MEYEITHASDQVGNFKSAFYPLVHNIWSANSGPQFTREHGPQSAVRILPIPVNVCIKCEIAYSKTGLSEDNVILHTYLGESVAETCRT